MARHRLGARRHFGNQKSGFRDALVKIGIFRRIYYGYPAGDHRHCAAGQRAVMRRGINPAGKARYDDLAFSRQVLGKRLCQPLCVDRGVSRADDSDRLP